jgi:hypothetical protein
VLSSQHTIYRCIYTHGEVHCTACGWTWKYIAQQAGIGNSQIHTNPQIHKSANPQINESANPQINESTNLSVCMGGCACYTIVISEEGMVLSSQHTSTVASTRTGKYIALHVVGRGSTLHCMWLGLHSKLVSEIHKSTTQIHTNPQIHKSTNPQINESTDLSVCMGGCACYTLVTC